MEVHDHVDELDVEESKTSEKLSYESMSIAFDVVEVLHVRAERARRNNTPQLRRIVEGLDEVQELPVVGRSELLRLVLRPHARNDEFHEVVVVDDTRRVQDLRQILVHELIHFLYVREVFWEHLVKKLRPKRFKLTKKLRSLTGSRSSGR